jgi:hypothetical protein
MMDRGSGVNMSGARRPGWGVLLVGAAVAIGGCDRDPIAARGQTGGGGRGGSSFPETPDAAGGRGGDGGSGRTDAAALDGWLPMAIVGQPCAAAAECATGFCEDGVCCSSACTSVCASCNAPGAAGTCLPLAAGTSCTGWRCAGDLLESPSLCDGRGACQLGPLFACAPFRCDPSRNQCFTGCATDEQCTPGSQCRGNSCAPPRGAVCQHNDECASGFCADGVCCNTACRGPCASCGLPGYLGTCTPVASGAVDPRGVCVDQGAASCGTMGRCDGGGACALYPAGTACAPESCVGDVFTPFHRCDGRGTCVRPAPLSCAPYVCGNNRCVAPCPATVCPDGGS